MCTVLAFLTLWFIFRFNYSWGMGTMYEVPKELIWPWPSFSLLFPKAVVYTLRSHLKYLTQTQGARWPIRMDSGHERSVYQWVLAEGQCLEHPSSPGRKKEELAAEALLLLYSHLYLTVEASSSHFSTLSKNLIIHFWKSCKSSIYYISRASLSLAR